MAEAENEKDVKKGSKLKWIVIATVVIVLGAGGFVGYRFLTQQGNAAALEEAPEETLPPEKKIVVPLQSYIVNLTDPLGASDRYLKINLSLAVAEEEDQQRINDNKTQISDALLLHLSSRSAQELMTAEGKIELKKALMLKMNQAIGAGVIEDVYFTEFVIQ